MQISTGPAARRGGNSLARAFATAAVLALLAPATLAAHTTADLPSDGTRASNGDREPDGPIRATPLELNGEMENRAVFGMAGLRPGTDARAGGVPPLGSQQGLQVPPPEVLVVLIRSALIGLDHANRTGNYSVLRELGGPGLQRLSSGQLSAAFADLRANNVNLLAVAVVAPQLVEPPAVSPEGNLVLAGFFPSRPRPIEFRIAYQPAGGQWKLADLGVSLPPSVLETKAAPQAHAPADGAGAERVRTVPEAFAPE